MAQRILVVGGGQLGLEFALRLSRKVRPGEAEITVVDPHSHMTYQSFLPEAAAGSIEPRHAVIPLRRVLRRCRIIGGTVTRIEHARRRVTVQPLIGPDRELTYDQLVVAPGGITRTVPVPGLAEQAVGFQSIGEAIWLRNRVIDRLDVAAATTDPAVRERALTFVFVGGGYAGVEALAELEDMARDAVAYYPELSVSQMRWVLVEAANRILPEVDLDLAEYTVRELRARGLDVRLSVQLKSCVDGHVVLSDGSEFESDTIAWTAGLKPSPMLRDTDLPLDERGRLTCRATMQVVDADGAVLPDVWAAGDSAAVPDVTSPDPGALCGPTAQHAVRQGRRLAANILAVLRGGEPTEYRHAYVGSVASLGLHKGVAQVYGIKVRGWPAWFMHRTYHMSKIPTLNRKVRVVADWTLNLVLRRETVALGELHEPRRRFESAAR
ncbi:NAD(P)/FAD-dependent oxidoreductase [Actinocatenispora rupis]|uniref:NADH dehydrogenase n=1 Tax=Actinocatenispora rupis TaxID=519421 RepID=A0A8J3J2I7_9ACTN|nr:NAD(P)/FAD-dependent oxidoreductase [Actinocatenispora rupis]GID10381.1 NADH dehydrogenase [Actinocatenispora rupis]